MSRCSARLVRRACPGVSMKTAWSSPRLRTPSTRCRVVCGLSVTMLSFSPTSVFSSVDLPTFGLPTMATNPQRPSPASLLLTRQHHEHRGGGFLLRSASALSSTGRLNIPFSNCALDDERLLVIAPLHRRDHVRRQGQAPALQPLLQP